MRIIISGGGSGGHIYPAIAIANALKERGIEDILFVGAQGKIEMEKVPKAGYKIEGLLISGFHRQRIWRNILFPIKLVFSLIKAKKIIDKFRPDVVVGVGGFASGPVLKMAQRADIPTLIQEQNSYPGVTNKLLAKNANSICVAYPNMDKYFDSTKIVLTGNPVRKDLEKIENRRTEGIEYFGLDDQKKTILIFGGSLGARSINQAVKAQKERIESMHNIQIIWQVGKVYYDDYRELPIADLEHVKMRPFIDRMDLAYSVADVIICRAGALTISEISMVGKPSVFVPSPNVAEDHQTKNAKALTDNDAAWFVIDGEAKEKMITEAVRLLNDKKAQESLSKNLLKLAKPNAREFIADEIIKLVKK